MFFLDHWKNLLLLTSPIRILVNYLRYDAYPFLDSHTLFKGYSLTNEINAPCAPIGYLAGMRGQIIFVRYK
jgi:hypothetical protein